MTERSGRPMAFEGVLILITILLVFALFCIVVTEQPGSAGTWQFAGNGTPAYLAVDDADTLYAFYDRMVIAIDSRGNERWNLTFPETGRVCCDVWTAAYIDLYGGTYPSVPFVCDQKPVYDIDSGNLYIYVQPDNYTCEAALMLREIYPVSDYLSINASRAIAAVSPDGKLLWSTILTGPVGEFDDTAIDAAGGRIYVFHHYNETVLDRSGNVLFSIPDVSAPASIDPSGMIYVSKSRPYQEYTGKELTYIRADFRVPSGDIEAYYPNGTLCWRYGSGMDLALPGHTIPIYRNGMLYLPARNGIAAIGSNGSLLWPRTYDEADLNLLDVMPFDDDGNVYLASVYGAENTYHVIGKDGSDVTQKMPGPGRGWSAGSDGIAYVLDYAGQEDGNRTLCALGTMTVFARDIKNGTEAWSYVLPLKNVTVLTIDEQNVYKLFDRGFADRVVSSNYWNITYDFPIIPLSEANITVKSRVNDGRLFPGMDVLYVSTYRYNYEDPITLNESRFAYSSCIYALGKNGSLLWYRSLEGPSGPIGVSGNTIYYSSGNDRISVTQVEAAAGVTLIAAAIVFMKFFLIGAVSRLKERLPKNPNRSKVYEFIRGNPGASLYEIRRGIGMNVGTIRYHLWILEANHRIVSMQADKKFVHYFPDSHSYSPEEQLAISIMKRDTMRRILTCLSRSPGLTNRELSDITDLQESAVSRYMYELMDKGLVVRLSACNRHTYRISDEYARAVEKAIGQAMSRP